MRRFALPASSATKINVTLIATGSVATIKVPEVIRALDKTRYNVILLPSHSSMPFLPSAGQMSCTVFRDSDEWSGWSRGDEILHIELRRWTDIVLVLPLSAHTLAKISGGLCDTLGLEVLRAWEYRDTWKRLACAPAMNSCMYTHPLTKGQLDILRQDLRFEILGPVEKELACGDIGIGGMVSVDTILQWIEAASQHILRHKSQGGTANGDVYTATS